MHTLYGDARLTISADPAFTVSYLAVVQEVRAGLAGRPGGWHVDAGPDPARVWIRVGHERARLGEQGWKLHVSASLWSAEAVLRRALPVLLAEPVCFKVAASPDVLASLNEGADGSLSQIGKFITVYPGDDDQAVRLAVALDERTRGLSGPPVPSDRPLRRGSLVHYRYGGLGELFVQTPVGEIVPALRTPAGELVPDVRASTYRAPAWAVDPFAAAGVVEALPAPSRTVGGRYAIAAPLHRSPRGSVLLALDPETPRVCVLKEARRGAQPAPDGSDARDRLRREAAVLDLFRGDDRVPEVLDLVEQDDAVYLAMEDVAGETLEERVGRAVRWGAPLPLAEVVDYGAQAASVLGAVHASGHTYRDLKPTNVIVSPQGRLRFVDFEMARRLHDDGDPADDHADDPGRAGLGTRGYMSPEQAQGAPTAVTDDVYSLGALLLLMATGAEPSRAPRPSSLLERPLRLLHPGIDPALEGVISRCLDPDPAARFPTASAVEAALRAVGAAPGPPPRPGTDEPDPAAEPLLRQTCRQVAGRLADSLCADARHLPGGAGAAWVSPHRSASGLLSRDLYVGSGGTLLALAELVEALGDPRHRAVLAEGARWLVDAPGPAGEPLAGLYVGEAGVGAALLRAGQVLADDGLVAAACDRGARVSALPFASPDLVNGTAGRLRFHLLLWDGTGAPEHLHQAVAAGEHLLSTSSGVGDGELTWVIPSGYGELSGTTPLGYAHGTAGIADALLDLHEATQEDRYRLAAEAAGRWLARHAVPVLADGTGVGWPMAPGGEPMPPHWCHGGAGVGRFLLHADELGLLPGARALWTGAARSTALGARWAGPTQCHGLAGSIEFLLDAYQASHHHEHLAAARSLSQLLAAFATEDGGLLRWPSDQPWVFSPDLAVGYAGVALALLRLAEPEERPHALSRAGFRRSAAAATAR